jgi:predicted nucleic acid-binding protein
MLVADTSALVSVATADLLETVLAEFDVHTTERVVIELEETADYPDSHGNAANEVLNIQEALTVHTIDNHLESARIDEGEGSCAILANDLDAPYLLTDDLRALPELETATNAQVAISPLVLRALVKRGVLDDDEARQRLERLAEKRDWLGAPIYRHARQLFEE